MKVDVLAVLDITNDAMKRAGAPGSALREQARAVVTELIEALREIADFNGDPNTPIRNSVKMSGIARAALAKVQP